MPQNPELILADTLPFINLLKLKTELVRMQPGDRLEVVLSDAETVNDLEKILKHSADRITNKVTDGDLIKISILRGNNTH
jgi:TusA-related sulfurtransferase